VPAARLGGPRLTTLRGATEGGQPSVPTLELLRHRGNRHPEHVPVVVREADLRVQLPDAPVDDPEPDPLPVLERRLLACAEVSIS